MKRLVVAFLTWVAFLTGLLLILSASLPARAQAVQLEPPPAVMPWVGAMPTVDWEVSLTARNVATCAAWVYRKPDDRFAGWVIGYAARVMPLADPAPWLKLAGDLWRQDGAALVAQRTDRLDSALMKPIADRCLKKARADLPPGPWLVAGGSGSRAGTRVVYALAGDSGSPKLGAALPDRATVGDKVSCADPARRFVASTGSVYCWHAAAGGLTLSREVP